MPSDNGLTFHKDYGEILSNRYLRRLNRAQKLYAEVFLKPVNLKVSEEFNRQFAQAILEKETTKLHEEIRRYHRRYPKSDFLEDTQAAKAGNDKLMFRLIEWDKEWLFISWVKERIEEAQGKNDLDFLKRLGEAVSKKPGGRPVPKSRTSGQSKAQRELLSYVELAMDVNFISPDDPVRLRKLHEALCQAGYIRNDGEERGLADPDYFLKWLRRNGLR